MDFLLVYAYLGLVGLSGLAIAFSVWAIGRTFLEMWREL